MELSNFKHLRWWHRDSDEQRFSLTSLDETIQRQLLYTKYGTGKEPKQKMAIKKKQLIRGSRGKIYYAILQMEIVSN